MRYEFGHVVEIYVLFTQPTTWARWRTDVDPVYIAILYGGFPLARLRGPK
jgi:hypothetical protein